MSGSHSTQISVSSEDDSENHPKGVSQQQSLSNDSRADVKQSDSMTASKESRKKLLRSRLREIKDLISSEIHRGRLPPAKKLGTSDALGYVVQYLRSDRDTPSTSGLSKGSEAASLCTDDNAFLGYGMDEIEAVNYAVELTVSVPSGKISTISGSPETIGYSAALLQGHKLWDIVDSSDYYLVMNCCSNAQSTKRCIFARLRSAVGIHRCQLLYWTSRAILHVLISSVESGYKGSKIGKSFTTKHSCSCHFKHISPGTVYATGYLPQDLVGKSLLSYAHYEDLDILKEAHVQVVHAKGRPTKSKPWRFRNADGTMLYLETEWTYYQNPWSKRIEFVAGRHKVLSATCGIGAGTSGIIDEAVIKEYESQIYKIIAQHHIASGQASPKHSKSSQHSSKALNVGKITRSPLSPGERIQLPAVTPISPPLPKIIPKETNAAMFVDNLIEQCAQEASFGIKPSHPAFTAASTYPALYTFLNNQFPKAFRSSPESNAGGSGSSPDSLGSGPSYTQIIRNENIKRYFESNPKTHTSDESSNDKTRSNPNGSPTYEAERSMSVRSMPLTTELLQRHEDAYRLNWKRRRSLFDHPKSEIEVAPSKYQKQLPFPRPASMPLLKEQLRSPVPWGSGTGTQVHPYKSASPGTLACTNLNSDRFTSLPFRMPEVNSRSSAHDIVARPVLRHRATFPPPGSTAYGYTSINTTIPVSSTISEPPTTPFTSYSDHNSGPSRFQPINLSIQADFAENTSAIRHRISNPSASSWPLQQTEPAWISGDVLNRYQIPVPADPSAILSRDRERLQTMSQPDLIHQQLDKLYSGDAALAGPFSEQSAVKEATHALMLLEEP